MPGKKSKLYNPEGLEIKQLTTSFHQDKHWLYEQSSEGFFLKYCHTTQPNPGAPAGTLAYCTTIHADDAEITPNEGDEAIKAVVLLPNAATEYGTDEQLVLEIQNFIHEWLDVDPLYERLATYYIMITWLYDQLHTMPYLRALGDTGVGKTRFLDVIGGLCYKATYINGAITAAPVFRLQEKWKGTLILDEGDLNEKSDATAEIMKMLNCGFERGKPVIRCDKEHPDQITTHDVYGPKIISSRQTFQDKALEARCITETMEETARQLPSTLTKTFFNKRQELRNKLLLFRFRNITALQERMKTDAGPTGLERLPIEPRLKQVGTPFAIIFHDKPEILKEFFNWIQENQAKLVEERATSLEGEIVEIIYESEQNNIDEGFLFVTAKNITEKLNEGRTKQLNSGTIGRILKSLGFENVLGRDDDGKVTRKIRRQPARLQKLYKRYVPNFIAEQKPSGFSGVSPIDNISQCIESVTVVTDVTDVTVSDSMVSNLKDIAQREEDPVTSVTSVTSVTKKPCNKIAEDWVLEPEDLGSI